MAGTVPGLLGPLPGLSELSFSDKEDRPCESAVSHGSTGQLYS